MSSISLNAHGQVGFGQGSAIAQAQEWANRQFAQAHQAARRGQVWSWLRRKADQLTTIADETAVCQTSAPQRMTVAVADVHGTLGGKTAAFDASFRPTSQHSRDRWVSIAAAFKMQRRLPPVELTKINNTYFVVDGHHRLSVAQCLGITAIDAIVTEAQLA